MERSHWSEYRYSLKIKVILHDSFNCLENIQNNQLLILSGRECYYLKALSMRVKKHTEIIVPNPVVYEIWALFYFERKEKKEIKKAWDSLKSHQKLEFCLNKPWYCFPKWKWNNTSVSNTWHKKHFYLTVKPLSWPTLGTSHQSPTHGPFSFHNVKRGVCFCL